MARILKRTITEDFELDEDAIKLHWFASGVRDAQPTDDELITLFEQHNGSAYGEEMFSQTDYDVGEEIIERED